MSDEARAGRFLGKQIGDRQVSELIGLARGLIADGEMNDREIEFLHKWLAASDSAHSNPMIGALIERLREIYADGYVDEDERADLTDFLIRLTGSDFELGEVLKSTSLPIDDPAPPILFEGSRFALTGTFSYGKRIACEKAVIERGGVIGGVAQSTRYLIIGEYATDAWAQSSFGRKIEQAVAWRSGGIPISIVSEEHWRRYL